MNIEWKAFPLRAPLPERPLHDISDGQPHWPDGASYALFIYRYEMLCRSCGAHFFMPDGEVCPACEGDDCKELSQDVREVRMDPETGYLWMAEE